MDVVAPQLVQLFQRPLNPIINGGDQAGAQFHAHGHPLGNHVFARAQAAGFFVNLDRSLVAAQFDDFADKGCYAQRCL